MSGRAEGSPNWVAGAAVAAGAAAAPTENVLVSVLCCSPKCKSVSMEVVYLPSELKRRSGWGCAVQNKQMDAPSAATRVATSLGGAMARPCQTPWRAEG